MIYKKRATKSDLLFRSLLKRATKSDSLFRSLPKERLRLHRSCFTFTFFAKNWANCSFSKRVNTQPCYYSRYGEVITYYIGLGNRSFALRSLQKERFALRYFKKSDKERFPLLLFTKRATKSDLFFCSLINENLLNLLFYKNESLF